jgi:hypothetical protein
LDIYSNLLDIYRRVGDIQSGEYNCRSRLCNGRGETYLKEKVDSLQDLIDLSVENDYQFFNENDENYNSALSQKVREYDDSYFINKALILVFSMKLLRVLPRLIQ